MSPTELLARIDALNSIIQSLKSEIDSVSNKVNTSLNNPTKLNVNLDQASRDVINRVGRDNFKQVKTIVTAGFTLLPQSQYILVSGTASRTSDTTTAIANGGWVGQPLIIEGTDNTNTVIIKDAANTQLAGDCTLGIYDTLTLYWNGKYWVEQARSNN